MRQVLVDKGKGFIQAPGTREMEDLFPEAHLTLSVQAEVFIRRARESRTDQGQGSGKFSTADQHSLF